MNVTAPALAAVLMAASMAAADETVKMEQLPAAVLETINGTHLGGPIKQITRRSEDGRTVYDVEIDKDAVPVRHLRIAGDGRFVREPVVPLAGRGAGGVAVPELSELAAPLRLADLPRPVQDTAKARAKGREIADVGRETGNGRTVYVVEFREPGRESRLYIAEDGSVVRPTLPAGPPAARMKLDETPPAVQATARRLAGQRAIVGVARSGAAAGAIYRVELEGPDGWRELRIRADGTQVGDDRAPEAAGSRPPAPASSGGGT